MLSASGVVQLAGRDMISNAGRRPLHRSADSLAVRRRRTGNCNTHADRVLRRTMEEVNVVFCVHSCDVKRGISELRRAWGWSYLV